jgi:hypothetical protein
MSTKYIFIDRYVYGIQVSAPFKYWKIYRRI